MGEDPEETGGLREKRTTEGGGGPSQRSPAPITPEDRDTLGRVLSPRDGLDSVRREPPPQTTWLLDQ